MKPLPCPFCAGEAEAVCLRISKVAINSWVRCLGCGASGQPVVGTRSELRDATVRWNNRPQIAALEYAMERIVALTPFKANAADAQDLHISIRAIGLSALEKSPGYDERPGLLNTEPQHP